MLTKFLKQCKLKSFFKLFTSFIMIHHSYHSTDHEAPVITCPSNQTVTCPSQENVTVVYTAPQVTDNSGENPSITCDVESGSTFKVGETTVICQAVDGVGNQAACSFTVIVVGMSSTYKENVWKVKS